MLKQEFIKDRKKFRPARKYTLDLGIDIDKARSFPSPKDFLDIWGSLKNIVNLVETELEVPSYIDPVTMTDWIYKDLFKLAERVSTDPVLITRRSTLLEALLNHDEVFKHIAKGPHRFLGGDFSSRAQYVGALHDERDHENLVECVEWLTSTPAINGVPVLNEMRSYGEKIQSNTGFKAGCHLVKLFDELGLDYDIACVMGRLEDHTRVIDSEKNQANITLDGNIRNIVNCSRSIEKIISELTKENIVSKQAVPEDYLKQLEEKRSMVESKSDTGHVDDRKYFKVVAGLVGGIHLGYKLLKEAYNAHMPHVIINGFKTLNGLTYLSAYYRAEKKRGRYFTRPKISTEKTWKISDNHNFSLRTQGIGPSPYSIKFSAEKPLIILTGEIDSGKSELLRDILRTQAKIQMGELLEASYVSVPIVDQLLHYTIIPDKAKGEGGTFRQNIRAGKKQFWKAIDNSLVALDEYATVGNDMKQLIEITKPIYYITKEINIPTLHAAHSNTLAEEYQNDPQVQLFAMGVDEDGIFTYNPIKGKIAESNALKVAHEEGLTMRAAKARVRAIKRQR